MSLNSEGRGRPQQTFEDVQRLSKLFVTSTSQGQKFQKFEEYPKSVRIKMADLAGR